ncbi:MAG: VanZ family protein [Lachnospiraceae bacterium]|nr:VanZ family protein [Lachnospiraceae bacterium]
MHGNVKSKEFKYLAWLPAMLIAAAIFYFSAQPADVSTQMSDGVTTLLLRIAEALGLMELSPEFVRECCELLSTPVRKCAHILEYMILHGAVLFALYHWSDDMRGRKWLIWAWSLTVLYACSDEFHQLFVPGRAGRVSDVIIDSIGVTIITWILWRRSLKYNLHS